MLDYTESPFWAMDDESKQKFGYNVGLNSLNLDENTVIRVKSITELFWQRLNPIYPGFPSLWSGRMHVFFQMFLKQVYSEIENTLRPKYKLVNDEHELMNRQIDVEQIDRELKEFLKDPSKYADANGISYKSKERLKEEIQIAHRDWEQIEFKWITI